MKLVKASVRNFRCIDDSTEFRFAPVTCLVGKNESGKTALLLALEKLNPNDPSHSNYNRLLDYPRKHLADYEELYPSGDAPVLETHWRLDTTEVRGVEAQFGSGILNDNLCVSERGTTTSWSG